MQSQSLWREVRRHSRALNPVFNHGVPSTISVYEARQIKNVSGSCEAKYMKRMSGAMWHDAVMATHSVMLNEARTQARARTHGAKMATHVPNVQAHAR